MLLIASVLHVRVSKHDFLFRLRGAYIAEFALELDLLISHYPELVLVFVIKGQFVAVLVNFRVVIIYYLLADELLVLVLGRGVVRSPCDFVLQSLLLLPQLYYPRDLVVHPVSFHHCPQLLLVVLVQLRLFHDSILQLLNNMLELFLLLLLLLVLPLLLFKFSL